MLLKSLIFLVVTSTALDGGAGPAVRLGEEKPIGAGRVRAWVKLDEDGSPRSVGVTLTADALRDLPADSGEGCCGGHEYSLKLPRAEGLPFDHVGINWNPQGHEPAGIYDLPHFDFHFYAISESERAQIKAAEGNHSPASRPPPGEQLPAGYVQAPGVVGRMGVHWVDPTAPEFNGGKFTHTFIYGSYNGRVTFVEPMITMAFLQSRRNVTAPIPQPVKSMDDRFRPAVYRIEHGEAGQISIILERAD